MTAALLVSVGRSFNRLIHALDRATPSWRSLRLSAWRSGHCPLRTPLVAEHGKGSERYGHLNYHCAEREQPDLSLDLRIHGSPNARKHGSFQGARRWGASKATENARKHPERGGMPKLHLNRIQPGHLLGESRTIRSTTAKRTRAPKSQRQRLCCESSNSLPGAHVVQEGPPEPDSYS
jgi:hypothetical protein